MNFEQSREYLTTALTFGIQMGLQRMQRLLELLDNPEQALRCIHVAGTNGKGSVSSYCATILAAAEHKVGVFTSPYLTRLTERIRVIDGRMGLAALQQDETAGEIAPDDFAAVMTAIRAAVDQMIAEGCEHPTEFELITAAGFLHFVATGCDVVVLETGLGGRLDSTNVIANPLACIITALGYDHMDRLGATLGEIAGEKAGIVKPGCPVFLYNPHDLELPAADADAALAVVQNRCQQLGAPLELVRQSDLQIESFGWEGQTFSDRVSGLTLQTSLLGLFQPMNATLAARVCRQLRLATDDDIRRGVALTRWPARLEVLRRRPPILLDGAHNPQGCSALAATLACLLPGQPVVYLIGMLQDKDYETMMRRVLDNPACQPLAVVCTTPDNPRALSAQSLADSVIEIILQLRNPALSGYNILKDIHAVDSPIEAAELALRLADRSNGALCAFGSLYMAGGIRDFLRAEEDQLWTGNN